MKTIGVIPSRFASTRFPGKPLAMIHGKTMIQRVYGQALSCRGLDHLVVATDHEAIRDHILSFGGLVVMTSEKHRSGTERCQEVVQQLASNNQFFDVVINIQGDEPNIDPIQIEQVLSCFQHPGTDISTLIKTISSVDELTSPDVVKVVADLHGKALYFSRSPIPNSRGIPIGEWLRDTIYYKHIGIYGYRSEILRQLVNLPVSPLELAESLEQLRWLENGFHIQTKITEIESVSVDTPADLLKITNKVSTPR